MTNNNSNLSSHITEESLLQPTIQAWKIYLKDQARSKYTIKAFIADLNLLMAFLPPDRTIGSVTTKDLENFTIWLEKERGVPCSPKSLSRRITSVKSFFKWLTQYGVLPIDPAEKLVQLSVRSPLPIALTSQEIDRALAAADKFRHAEHPDARPYTLLKLLLETGIKKGECISLNLNHLDTENDAQPAIFVRYTNPRYRYKERKLPVSNEWIEVFTEYQQQYQLTKELFPWSQRRLEYILEDIGNLAQLDNHLSFAMCRWTCALQQMLHHVDSDHIRQVLGISKIQWREVQTKLRALAAGQGVDLLDDTKEEA